MIEAISLKKTLAGVEAVKDVSFVAPDGRITGILGPNGAGKTTTLRMLYALLRPDAGVIRVDGLDTSQVPDAVRRRIGVLPDARGLYPRLTPREHIHYYGRLHGMDQATLLESTQHLLELLDMNDFADRRTEGMSMGQRLKVAIARALVHSPQNILLDEPTNGLDVMSTRAMRTVLRSLRASGKCVLFSSHIMQEVGALCDDVVVMAQGRVVAHGTPEALRSATGMDSLEDAFVAVLGSAEGMM